MYGFNSTSLKRVAGYLYLRTGGKFQTYLYLRVLVRLFVCTFFKLKHVYSSEHNSTFKVLQF